MIEYLTQISKKSCVFFSFRYQSKAGSIRPRSSPGQALRLSAWLGYEETPRQAQPERFELNGTLWKSWLTALN